MEVSYLVFFISFLFFSYMDNPNIICWNCRGISSKATSDRVRFLIRSHRPKIICLVETRANADRTYRFCSKISKNWEWAAILADGFSGGIIVLWDKFLGYVTPIAVSRRDLHLVISTNNSFNWVLSVIYNSTRLNSQRALWLELSRMSSIGLPWLILGDFNSIINRSEHHGGSFRHYSRKATVFYDFIDSNNLFYLNFSGFQFTWCNNQTGSSRRWARLDQ